MLAVPVFNMQGKQTGQVEIDPDRLGGQVRPRLLKQAIVAYTDHLRQDSARTRGKKDVEGSTRKLYRQKGTGNARAGQVRTPVRRGGGRAFAKQGPASVKELPKKMRRLARNNAILAKIERENVLIVDDLRCDGPKTKVFATMLSALGAKRGALVAMHDRDANLFLSGRNIHKTEVRLVDDLNAYDILRREKLIFTRPAFERIAGGSTGGQAASGTQGGKRGGKE